MEDMAKQLHTTHRTLAPWLDDPSKYSDIDFATMICLILKLPDWLSKLMFKRAHVQLDDEQPRDQAIEHILRAQFSDGIEKANETWLSTTNLLCAREFNRIGHHLVRRGC